MSDRTQKWILNQIKSFRNNACSAPVRRLFGACSAPVLPFTEILVPALVSEILTELGVTVRQRIYAPFTTLCVFLSQVLSEEIGRASCRERV